MRLALVPFVLAATAGLAAADTTITVRGGSWQDYGWPSGAPTLLVEGKRLASPASAAPSLCRRRTASWSSSR